MNFYLLLLSVAVAVPTILAQCSTPKCDYSCGLSVKNGECAQCDCSKHPSDKDCPGICPADCGRITLPNGCLSCPCRPWFPIPPEQKKKDCPRECPQDCGQKRLPNGCLECDCNVGPWYPIPKPDCVKICPADCGQTVKSDGCLQCHCDQVWFKPEE